MGKHDGRHAKKAHATRTTRTLVMGCVLLIMGALCVTLPFMLMVAHSYSMKQATATHTEATTRMDDRHRAELLDAARHYNARLAASGQPVMGEANDPFTTGTDHGSDQAYREYEGLLNDTEDGMMSVIIYPRLDITLPVAHGTDPDTLETTAGHLYGSSLPVGGKNTHTVISAHSGMADRLMFDRLNGLGSRAKKGDMFYLRTLGTTMAYKVVKISVVNPDEFDTLKIVPNEDMATLLTCTPYGVNTQRLLVTGVRVAIPNEAPEPEEAPKSRFTEWTLVACALIWVFIITVIVITVLRRKRATSHKPDFSANFHKVN